MALLVRNGTLVTLDAQRRVLAADLLVEGGRIQKIGKRLKAPPGATAVDASGQVVLPGLIHGHLHACQTLFRNRADGLQLLDWLKQRIWPFEAAHDARSLRASADLTFAELIRSGSTAALDMGTVHHTDEVFASARDAGFRLTGGKAMMDAGVGVPSGLKETTRSSLDESVALIDRWHGAADGRLRYAFAPRFVLSCTDDLLAEVVRLTHARGVRIHTHASENPSECAVVRERTGRDNVEHFHKLGLTGPHATFAHCVWLSRKEQRILRETGTVVCHCPSSNLKLASGIARVPELMDAGVHVCLGADGAPCNNNLDMFVEMRLAALLHKPRVGPLAMPPVRVLEMATLEGARALGLQDELGSLEVGKRADLCTVSLSGLHATPNGEDVMAAVVHSAQSSDVRHVVIDGRIVMRDRELLTLDEEAVRARADAEVRKLLRRLESPRRKTA